MVFYDGARALWGLRRSLIFERGEGQQRADPSSPPQSESGTRAWQVMGGLRKRFLVCAGCTKGAQGRPKKDDWSTRVAAREQPEAPRLQFSSGGSHNILKFPAWKDIYYGGAPPRAIPKKMAALHGCGLGVGCLQVSGRLGAFLPNYIQ